MTGKWKGGGVVVCNLKLDTIWLRISSSSWMRKNNDSQRPPEKFPVSGSHLMSSVLSLYSSDSSLERLRVVPFIFAKIHHFIVKLR
jgi:hypothetical protein